MKKRIAFFAHYDRDGIIDDYVIYYLQALMRVSECILFASDCELKAGETEKLDGIAKLVFAERHGEYDFGSWKRCFEYLNYDLSSWDELILANDSCYAPIFPLESAFEKMNSSDCALWSPHINQNQGEFDHLSSFFLVIRRPVLADEKFFSFWRCIDRQPNVDAVVQRYERGLSQLIVQRGYSYDSLTPATEIGSFLKTGYLQRCLHQYRLSWLKVRLLRENPYGALGIGRGLKKTEHLYPRPLIDAHMLRMTGSAWPPHFDRWFIGNYGLSFGLLSLVSKIKRPRKGKAPIWWWKVYIRLLGIPFFAFIWPIRPFGLYRGASTARRGL
jgi:lipopolysaccharide biosynthesis protein